MKYDELIKEEQTAESIIFRELDPEEIKETEYPDYLKSFAKKADDKGFEIHVHNLSKKGYNVLLLVDKKTNEVNETVFSMEDIEAFETIYGILKL